MTRKGILELEIHMLFWHVRAMLRLKISRRIKIYVMRQRNHKATSRLIHPITIQKYGRTDIRIFFLCVMTNFIAKKLNWTSTIGNPPLGNEQVSNCWLATQLVIVSDFLVAQGDVGRVIRMNLSKVSRITYKYSRRPREDGKTFPTDQINPSQIFALKNISYEGEQTLNETILLKYRRKNYSRLTTCIWGKESRLRLIWTTNFI